jgi:hypothetical protein
MKRRARICLGLLFVMAVPVWGQIEGSTPPPDTQTAASDTGADIAAERMITPPPVSGLAHPVVLTSPERSNYVRGGLAFMTAYIDNALGSVGPTPLSDVSYSVAPFVAMNQTTAREQLALTYAPGFTFYQRFNTLDRADQNATLRFAYLLSPHVTFSASDTFQKTSDVFNQPFSENTGVVNTGPALPNFSVIAPVANQLSNAGYVELTYQFELNDMIGASGTFTNLHYPNPRQVPGLFDSSSQSGLGFWAHRLSRRRYFGVAYQRQRLLAYPAQGLGETQTHALLLFYSVHPAKNLTASFYGGPQYSDTVQPSTQPPLKQWTPAIGASLSGVAHLTSVAVNCVHLISTSPGLGAAVKLDSDTAFIRQQLTKHLSASISGGYTQNDILGNFNASSLGLLSGHSISGTGTLERQFGRDVTLQLGYMRLRQDYRGVPILALTPNTNREFVSLICRFGKALGR